MKTTAFLAKKVSFIGFSIAMLLAAVTMHAGPQAAFWKGDSGVWDTTTANWSLNNFSGPFTSTFGASGQAYIGGVGGAGTITLGNDFSIADLGFAISGYTLALAGHTLSFDHSMSIEGSLTLDFASTSSQFMFTTNDNFSAWSTLTIDNYVSGSSVLRIGIDNTLVGDIIGTVHFTGYTNGGAAQIDSSGNITPTGVLSAIPEPSAYAALLGLGAFGFTAFRRRKSA